MLIIVVMFITQAALTASASRTRVIDSAVATIEQTNLHLSFLLEKAQNIAFVLSSNDNLMDLAHFDMETQRSVYSELQLINQVMREIMFLADLNADIDTIYVYLHGKRRLITSAPNVYGASFFPDAAWVDVALEIESSHQWISNYIDEGLSDRRYLSIVCRADILRPEIRPVTYVGVNLSERYVYQTLERLKATPNSRVYLVDDAGQIAAARDETLIGRELSDTLPAGVQATPSTEPSAGFAGGHLTVYEPCIIPGWGIFLVASERELFRDLRTALLIPLAAIVILATVLFVVASRLIGREVSEPIGTLVSFMERAEQGDFDARIREERDDEFGFLYRSYNSMVNRISQLVRELFQERVLKQEMELQFLQNQVNPHFLYNTLDTINWIAKKHNAEEISRIVMSLSQLYRTIFNKGRDYISIAEVMKGVQSFLYIEQFRYGCLEQFTFDVDPRVAECRILNLIVQPLVENAVVHGIGEQNTHGCVTIRATHEPPVVRIRVQDNGPGIDQQKLSIIRRSINRNGDSAASGLRNVNRRIQLVYGEEFGVQIESVLGGGTTASITVPCEGPRRNVDGEPLPAPGSDS